MAIFIAGATMTVVTGVVCYFLRNKIKEGFKQLWTIIKTKLNIKDE